MFQIVTRGDSLIERTQSCRKRMHGGIDTSRGKIITKGGGYLPGKCLLAIDRIMTIQKMVLDSVIVRSDPEGLPKPPGAVPGPVLISRAVMPGS